MAGNNFPHSGGSVPGFVIPVKAGIHADLVRIEADIQKATLKHNEFLKELGKRLLPTAD